jgi:hypothetical protein
MPVTCKEISSLLGASFTPLLKLHGFLKTRLTWQREMGRITQVFNIQKSAWDQNPHHCSYYINLRVQLREPTEPRGSGEVSARLGSIATEYDDSLLRFENCDASECADRIHRVCVIVSEKGLPWLSQLSNLNEIRSAYDAGMFRSLFAGVAMLRAIGVTRVTDRTGQTHGI